MRHGKKFNHLGRTAPHRKAMLANMTCSLIEHKSIKTTWAKAKALRKYAEPLLTKSKTDTSHSRRVVFSYLQSNEAINELFNVVAPAIGSRPGGYTRILRLGNRKGDNAPICIIQLVDFNEFTQSADDDTEDSNASGKRRRRRKKKSAVAETEGSITETVEEAVEEVVEDTQVEGEEETNQDQDEKKEEE